MLRMLALFLVLLLSGCNQEKASNTPMLNITPYSYVSAKIGKGKPVLLELGSTSCSGCQDMARSLYRIKKQYPQSEIYFIDIKRERQVAEKYDVRMMPTQVILDKNGKVIQSHIGPMGTKELTDTLQKHGII